MDRSALSLRRAGLRVLGLYNQPMLEDATTARLLRSLAMGAPALTRLHAGRLMRSAAWWRRQLFQTMGSKDAAELCEAHTSLHEVHSGAVGGASAHATSQSGSGDADGGIVLGRTSSGSSSEAACAMVELIEQSTELALVDLRDSDPLPPALATRLDEAVRRREGALVVRGSSAGGNSDDLDERYDGSTNDVFAALEGWHTSGCAESRSMWCVFSQTIIFLEGDDAGAEMNQPAFIIEEPGGERSLAAGGMPHAPPGAT